jgi:hypothetical protein
LVLFFKKEHTSVCHSASGVQGKHALIVKHRFNAVFYRFARVTLLLPLIISCGKPAPPPAPQSVAANAAVLSPRGYKAVLIAGDGSLNVFDNAVSSLSTLLQGGGVVAPADITRLSATRSQVRHRGVRLATLSHVLAAIAAMKPSAGQGCFVFATSHGGEDEGFFLDASQNFLTPEALDQALARGCSDAPTVVVISACFSGVFARPPMVRANRIVLTAARPDRTSFGCQAGRRFTVYDRCLLESLPVGHTWPQVYDDIKDCVADEEERQDATPSEPQAWFGAAVADIPVPLPPSGQD